MSNNGLKDIAQLVALLVADLKADNDSHDEALTMGDMEEILLKEEELKLQQFREELGKLDPRAPVWGKVDERIDREWDRNDD